ncbi:MAG: hypothetical protein ICV64_12325 [Thermoleophilia bacterium]|nr:hypothetical protein [Thermoleophilia bacterium]
MVGVRRGGTLADGVEFAGVFEIAPAAFFESGRMPRQDEAAALLHHSWTLVPRQPSLAASVSEARA